MPKTLDQLRGGPSNAVLAAQKARRAAAEQGDYVDSEGTLASRARARLAAGTAATGTAAVTFPLATATAPLTGAAAMGVVTKSPVGAGLGFVAGATAAPLVGGAVAAGVGKVVYDEVLDAMPVSPTKEAVQARQDLAKVRSQQVVPFKGFGEYGALRQQGNRLNYNASLERARQAGARPDILTRVAVRDKKLTDVATKLQQNFRQRKSAQSNLVSQDQRPVRVSSKNPSRKSS